MIYTIEPLFDKATELLDREDRRLQALMQAVSNLSPNPFDPDGVSAMSRALTYVVCGGILEDLLRKLPDALSQDIMALNITRSKLPISLLAVLEAEYFRKCAAQTTTALMERSYILRAASTHSTDIRPTEPFGSVLVIADGTTISSKHLEALWRTLDLPGDWRNEANDLFLMSELREKRNDVAHWLEDPVDIGKSKTYSDLRTLLRRVRNLTDHVYLTLSVWLDDLSRP
jgi:hypothetical protein